MARLHAAAEGTTSAAPQAIWALLADARRYPEWGPWAEAAYTGPGESSERGPGATYWLRSSQRYLGRPVITREKILIADEPSHLAYTVTGGLPLRNYRADVTLTPAAGGGTRVRWSADWDATVRGRMAYRGLSQLYPRCVAAVCAAAERQAAS